MLNQCTHNPCRRNGLTPLLSLFAGWAYAASMNSVSNECATIDRATQCWGPSSHDWPSGSRLTSSYCCETRLGCNTAGTPPCELKGYSCYPAGVPSGEQRCCNEAHASYDACAPTPTPSPSPSNCGIPYAQCGGIDFHGPHCCIAGFTCVEQSQYYSQCQPPKVLITSTKHYYH